MSETDLDQAAGELATAVADAAAMIAAHPNSQEGQRAAGYMFWMGMILARIEGQVVFEVDFPMFRVVDPRSREGGDNADQRYLTTKLNGGDTYRVWGSVGRADRLEFQIYAGGAPWDPNNPGRMASHLAFEDLRIEPDGSFEVVASPDRVEGNWLENPSDGSGLLVRQVYSDWGTTVPGEVHIDRVGHEGDRMPALSEERLVRRLRAAAKEIRQKVALWPRYVQRQYVEAIPANTISELSDPGEMGGVAGRWMAAGHFDLDDEQALVITTRPAPGNYQGIQLCDLWFSSMEYANRQSSLTGHQAVLDDDGRYRFVVAGTDPGVANWLDTGGLRRGVVLLRFDGTGQAPIDPTQQPTAEVVALADLDEHLPVATARRSPAERAADLARRRRHVQQRFGY